MTTGSSGIGNKPPVSNEDSIVPVNMKGRNMMIAGKVIGTAGTGLTLAISVIAALILFSPIGAPALAIIGTVGVGALAIAAVATALITASVALGLHFGGKRIHEKAVAEAKKAQEKPGEKLQAKTLVNEAKKVAAERKMAAQATPSDTGGQQPPAPAASAPIVAENVQSNVQPAEEKSSGSNSPAHAPAKVAKNTLRNARREVRNSKADELIGSTKKYIESVQANSAEADELCKQLMNQYQELGADATFEKLVVAADKVVAATTPEEKETAEKAFLAVEKEAKKELYKRISPSPATTRAADRDGLSSIGKDTLTRCQANLTNYQ